MKKSIFVAVLGLFIMSFASMAFAAKTISLVNGTPIVVREIYLSGSGSDNWEEDVLGDEVLQPGEYVSINIRGSYPLWDIKLIGENGAEAEFYQVDFNRFSKVTLHADGSATGE